MRIKKKQILAMTAASMLAIGTLGIVPASAANYTPISGGATTFEKYLITDAGAKIPNVTFSYTITPGTARSSDTSSNAVMEVMAGVGSPTASSTTFSPNNTTYTSVQTGDIDVARAASERGSGLTADTGVEFETSKGEKYAVQTSTVDFSGVSFAEPGIYRYIITETASSENAAAGIMHDNDTDRVLDVYVVHADGSAAVTEAWIYNGDEYASEAEAQAAADTDQGATSGEGDYSGITHREAQAGTSEGLQVAAYVLHTVDGDVTINATMGSADVAAQGAALSDKTDGFTNEYKTTDLKVSKDVTGNQASRDKYFALTVELEGLNPNGIYEVSIADDDNENTTDGNADATSGTNTKTKAANAGQTNVTSITAGADGKKSQTFYLQHGQSIVIRGIPQNATYKVSEDQEDYKPSYKIDDNDPVNAAAMSEAASFGGNDHTVAFTNESNGIIPTGILVSGAIGIGALVLGIGGFGAVKASKKRRDKEEQEA